MQGNQPINPVAKTQKKFADSSSNDYNSNERNNSPEK